MEETDTTFAIAWKGRYRIDGRLGGRQLTEPGAAIFLDRLLPRLDRRRQRRLGLVQMALLHAELLLLLDVNLSAPKELPGARLLAFCRPKPRLEPLTGLHCLHGFPEHAISWRHVRAACISRRCASSATVPRLQ
jgi:hypothetical protein